MGKKRFIKPLIISVSVGAVAIGVTFFGIPHLLNVWGCFSCSLCRGDNTGPQAVNTIEPGTYALTKQNFNKFMSIDVNRSGAGNNSEFNFFEKCYGVPKTFGYSHAAKKDFKLWFDFVPTKFKTNVSCGGCSYKTTEANYQFEDCSVELQVTINKKTSTYTVPLNRTGDTEFWTPPFEDAAYEFTCNYKVLSCNGTVFVPPNEKTGILNKDGFKLKYKDGHYEIVGFTSSPKVLTIPASIDVGAGDVPIKNLKTIFTYNSDSSRVPGRDLLFTQTIIFDGNYEDNDLNFKWELYDSAFKDIFKSIKNIVIRNITGGGYISPTFVLPPSGVNFYVNDNTSQRGFVGALNNASFVNGIYSFDEYRG